jgi:hypothetical protein
VAEAGRYTDGDERAADMIRMYQDMDKSIKDGKFKPMDILQARLDHNPTCEHSKKEYIAPSDDITSREA